MKNKLENLTVVVPCAEKYALVFKKNHRKYFDKLGASVVVCVGPASVKEACGDVWTDEVRFVDEDEVVDKAKFLSIFSSVFPDHANKRRAMWYYQQFVKLMYGAKESKRPYLVFDADTIPIKKMAFFDVNDGKYVFHVRKLKYRSYNRTIKRLFGYDDVYDHCFVCEHMLFNPKYVSEMFKRIMASTELIGDSVYERILRAIDANDFALGFAEFETYAMFCMMEHDGVYKTVPFESARCATAAKYRYDTFTDEHAQELVEMGYGAISFEIDDYGNRLTESKIRPRVSVVTCVRNGEKYIDEAVQSVVNQTFRDFEYIIVDDASTDSTSKKLKRWCDVDSRIRVFTRTTNNYAEAQNDMLDRASGEFWCRIDADDVMLPNRLNWQLSIMEKNPNLAVLGGMAEEIDALGVSHGLFKGGSPREHSAVVEQLVENDCVINPTVFARKDFFVKNEIRYRTGRGADYIMWLDVALAGGVFKVDATPVIKYRKHDNNISKIPIGSEDAGEIKKLKAKLRAANDVYFKSFMGKRVVVTMTSWTCRIHLVYDVAISIFANSRPPDVLILNLSKIEFPRLENSVPYELVELWRAGKLVLNFCEGNQKAFKKLGPSLKMFGDAIYIVVDDDIIYPSTFVQDMLESFSDNGCRHAITSWKTDEHCGGCGCLFTGEMLTGFYDKLNDEIVNTNEDDLFYTWLVHENGFSFKTCPKVHGLPKLQRDPKHGLGNLGLYNSRDTVRVLNKYFMFKKDSINGAKVENVFSHPSKPLDSETKKADPHDPLMVLKGWKPSGYRHF